METYIEKYIETYCVKPQRDITGVNHALGSLLAPPQGSLNQ
jgi:hypothetical protein